MANTGTPTLLNYMLQRVTNNYLDWLLMLWTNPTLSPTPATVYADFTEATFTGYSRRVILHNGWGDPVIIDGAFARSVYTNLVAWYPSGTPQTVYGYAIITPTPFDLICSQKFDAPYEMVPGGTLQFYPRMELGTKP